MWFTKHINGKIYWAMFDMFEIQTADCNVAMCRRWCRCQYHTQYVQLKRSEGKIPTTYEYPLNLICDILDLLVFNECIFFFQYKIFIIKNKLKTIIFFFKQPPFLTQNLLLWYIKTNFTSNCKHYQCNLPWNKQVTNAQKQHSTPTTRIRV